MRSVRKEVGRVGTAPYGVAEAVAAGRAPSVSRLLILSEICLYREGLARLVTQAIDAAVVRTASTLDDALGRLSEEPADVVLIDLALLESLGAARVVLRRFPATKLVGLGVGDDQAQIVACAEAGFTGFVSRGGSTNDLVEAISGAVSGELVCSRRIAGALAARVAALAAASRAPEPEVPLTRRELQVLRLLDEGLTNKEIASRLYISTATARNHVHSILDRLGVRTRSRAAAVARRILTRV